MKYKTSIFLKYVETQKRIHEWVKMIHTNTLSKVNYLIGPAGPIGLSGITGIPPITGDISPSIMNFIESYDILKSNDTVLYYKNTSECDLSETSFNIYCKGKYKIIIDLEKHVFIFKDNRMYTIIPDDINEFLLFLRKEKMNSLL